MLHTSRESSKFQIALIPSLASTVILNVVALTVTPNPMKGRDTLKQTKSAKMRQKTAANMTGLKSVFKEIYLLKFYSCEQLENIYCRSMIIHCGLCS